VVVGSDVVGSDVVGPKVVVGTTVGEGVGDNWMDEFVTVVIVDNDPGTSGTRCE